MQKKLMTAVLALSLPLAVHAASWPDRSTLPIPLSPFEGKAGKTYKESTDAWQKVPTAPEGAPNVLVILLDDVGFGQTSTFGGLIPTPNFDRLADEGLRYNRFHTTAVSGPSRAALLTGRNHHDTGNGFLMEWAVGQPNYSTMIPRDTATLGRILQGNGYSTWWYGKNHNTPDWETSVTGPFDRWPTGMGFDYFYGFNAGETHQFYPTIFENTLPVAANKAPEQGYHFTTDITDRAIERMRYAKSIAPDKPFFMYYAPGAMHAPHHVTAEWRDKFKGKFDMGWDKYREEVYQRQLSMGIIPPGTQLSARPDWVPAWDTLDAKQKKLYSRFMENFAGFFAQTDYEIGRLIDAVDQLPDADNTMVIFIAGDNGASSEGGPDGTVNEIKSLNGEKITIDEAMHGYDDIGNANTEAHYPIGWAWAGNTPFPWVKQVASHLGGTRNPMVVRWPAKIKHDAKPRDQYLHLVDVVPTVLEAAHIPMPKTVDGVKQKPLAGKSFLASFNDASVKGRDTQYYEVLSNRAVYDKGWLASAQHTLPWRQDLAPGNWDNDKWELYNLDEDFSQSVNLADKYPQKLRAMKAKFDKEAGKYHVYPLDDRGAGRLVVPKPGVPGSRADTTSYVYYAGATRLAEPAAPQIKNRSWSLTADLKTKGAETEGVVMAFGGVAAGLTFYLDKGVPVFDYNWFDEHTTIKASKPLPAGTTQLVLDFAYDGGGSGKGGTVTIRANGQEVAKGRVEKTVGGRFGVDTFGIGEDSGQPVTFAYAPPFKFTGEIDKVTIDLK
ncbi:arylsulfatase [Chitinibacteraceae bacterium HSL-7]